MLHDLDVAYHIGKVVLVYALVLLAFYGIVALFKYILEP